MPAIAAGIVLLFLQIQVIRAAILNGSWPESEEELLELAAPKRLWRKIASADRGKTSSCQLLGTLTDFTADENPDACYLRAALLHADTLEIDSSGTVCHLRQCFSQTATISSFTNATSGFEVHSLLWQPWVLLAYDGPALACQEVGTTQVPVDASFDNALFYPEICAERTIELGGDSFDVASDFSSCTSRLCTSGEGVAFNTNDGMSGFTSFSVVVTSFIQIVDKADGYGSACTYLGSYQLTADISDPVAACSSLAFAQGADTFDWSLSKLKCYFKTCGDFESMVFSADYGSLDVYTRLGGTWSQMTRSSDGVSVDCTQLGAFDLDSTANLPTRCYSKAILAGANAVSIDVDQCKCYLSKCASFKELAFKAQENSEGETGKETHSLLLPSSGWTQVVEASVAVVADCEVLGTLTDIDADLAKACFAQAHILGGDTVGLVPSSSSCSIHRCSSYDSLAFAASSTGEDVFTLLSPWTVDDDWPLCEYGSGCVNLHILWTAELRGRFFPVTTSGATCDPSDSDDCYGGHARRATYLAEQRAKMAARDETVFFADLGGTAFGGPVYGHPDYAYGIPSAMMQNALDYDMCVLGTSDFLAMDNETLREEYATSFYKRDCPWLISNMDFGSYFEGLNEETLPYIVKTLPTGAKVGFVGMITNTLGAVQGYSPDIFVIDENNRYNELLNGEARSVALDIASLAQMGDDFTQDQYNIFALASEAPTGVITALEKLRSEHADIDALILLTGMSARPDQTNWISKNLPFDVIISGSQPQQEQQEPEIVVTATNRTVLLVNSRTLLGLGSLSVRVSKTSGVEKYAFTADQELDSTVADDRKVQELMTNLYQTIRVRNNQSFGRLDNPLTGGHRVGEAAPSWYQCYCMDCPAGDHLGRAMLWKARDAGYSVDISFANLGGFRAILEGSDPTGDVFLDQCIATLQFQNTLKLYDVLGKDLYAIMENYVKLGEHGFIGAGMRMAIHHPCWDFVDLTSYSFYIAGSIGTEAELEACQASGITNYELTVVDMQIKKQGVKDCDGDTECEESQWQRIEKGATYTIVSTNFISESVGVFESLDVDLGSEAVALCEYVAAHQPVGVESYLAYHARGSVRYATAAEGWATGARLVEVETSEAYVEAEATCPDGKYLPEDARACESCPVGTRSTTDPDRTSCDECATGFYGNEESLSQCKPCPSGKYSHEAGQTNCSDCEAGTWSILGSSSCWPCQAGFYAAERGAGSCEPCEYGYYASGTEATNCTQCPDGFSTAKSAAKSIGECVCPEGSYRPADSNTTCLSCPEGMTCPFGSDSLNFGSDGGIQPLLAAGYMAMKDSPLTVYKCRSEQACPGGKEGTCGALRDASAIACGECQAGAYEDGDGCSECGDVGMLPLLGFTVVGVIGVTLIVLFASGDAHKRSRGASLATIVAGLQVAALQIAGIFDSLNFTLLEPLRTLCDLASLLAFDLRIMHIECVFGSDPVSSFALRQLVVPTCIPIALLALLWRKRRQPKLDFIGGFTNSMGSLFVAFYLSLILGCALPILCYRHVGNVGSSMISYPSIMCWTQGKFEAMFIIGIVSFCLLPLPFTAFVILATYRHPHALANYSRGNNALQVERIRFLWSRFSPKCHYYTSVLLLRSFVLSFVPVMAPSDAALQVGLFYGVLTLSAITQAGLRPWRFEEANWLELVSTMILLSIVLCGGLAEDIDIQSDSFQGLTTGIAVGVVLFAVIAALLCAVRMLRRASRFDRFICHHKSCAAAQARLLKTLLKARGVKNVFIDSDDLVDLDELFDIVKFQVRELVVWLTGQLLTRAWCVGEIVSAVNSHNRIIAVHCEDFLAPQMSDPQDVRFFLDETDCQLSAYGISNTMVFQAIQQLLKPSTKAIFMTTFEGSRTFDIVVAELLNQPVLKPAAGHELLGKKDHRSLLVSACRNDLEAVAAAEVLVFFMQVTFTVEELIHFVRLYDLIEEDIPHPQALGSDQALIVLLSRHSLLDDEQLDVISEGVSSGLVLVHASLPDFVFPGADYYNRVLPDVRPDDHRDVTNFLDYFFKQISIFVPIASSEESIRLQCERIHDRVKVRKKMSTSDHTSTGSMSRLSLPRTRGTAVGARKSDLDSTDLVGHDPSSSRHFLQSRLLSEASSASLQGVNSYRESPTSPKLHASANLPVKKDSKDSVCRDASSSSSRHCLQSRLHSEASATGFQNDFCSSREPAESQRVHTSTSLPVKKERSALRNVVGSSMSSGAKLWGSSALQPPTSKEGNALGKEPAETSIEESLEEVKEDSDSGAEVHDI